MVVTVRQSHSCTRTHHRQAAQQPYCSSLMPGTGQQR
jgi:hypothetical protein